MRFEAKLAGNLFLCRLSGLSASSLLLLYSFLRSKFLGMPLMKDASFDSPSFGRVLKLFLLSEPGSRSRPLKPDSLATGVSDKSRFPFLLTSFSKIYTLIIMFEKVSC